MKEIEHIISKSIVGELTLEEKDKLEDWILNHPDNIKDYKAYTELWNKSKELVLSDSIDVEASLVNTKRRIKLFRSNRRRSTSLIQVAAVIILSVTFSILFNYFIQKEKKIESQEQAVYQEIKVAYGTQTEVILADGTNVWLNSGSTLRFPNSFQNTNERRVVLNGEGFFDVTKNDAKPFIVNTSKLDVQVFGTSFNVSAYDDYSTMTVALVEGKISLKKQYSSEVKELIVLNPNEVVEYNMNEKKLYHSADNNYMQKYIAWKEGQIVFYGDPIDRVIKRLEKWYNVDINITDNALQNYSFTATFVDESLEQVLRLLCLSSQMQYKITPAQKQRDNSFSRRKVTLSIN